MQTTAFTNNDTKQKQNQKYQVNEFHKPKNLQFLLMQTNHTYI